MMRLVSLMHGEQSGRRAGLPTVAGAFKLESSSLFFPERCLFLSPPAAKTPLFRCVVFSFFHARNPLFSFGHFFVERDLKLTSDTPSPIGTAPRWKSHGSPLGLPRTLFSTACEFLSFQIPFSDLLCTTDDFAAISGYRRAESLFLLWGV